MSDKFYTITLPTISQKERGDLIVMQALQNISFAIKRIYLIKNVSDKDIIRGQHAHRKTEQALFCIQGRCDFLADDGQSQESICLDKAEQGVYIGTYLWHSMLNFSKDCILLVLASEYYDKNDYIQDYQNFLKEIKSALI